MEYGRRGIMAQMVATGDMGKKYNASVDRESAYELLTKKANASAATAADATYTVPAVGTIPTVQTQAGMTAAAAQAAASQQAAQVNAQAAQAAAGGSCGSPGRLMLPDRRAWRSEQPGSTAGNVTSMQRRPRRSRQRRWRLQSEQLQRTAGGDCSGDCPWVQVAAYGNGSGRKLAAQAAKQAAAAQRKRTGSGSPCEGPGVRVLGTSFQCHWERLHLPGFGHSGLHTAARQDHPRAVRQAL